MKKNITRETIKTMLPAVCLGMIYLPKYLLQGIFNSTKHRTYLFGNFLGILSFLNKEPGSRGNPVLCLKTSLLNSNRLGYGYSPGSRIPHDIAVEGLRYVTNREHCAAWIYDHRNSIHHGFHTVDPHRCAADNHPDCAGTSDQHNAPVSCIPENVGICNAGGIGGKPYRQHGAVVRIDVWSNIHSMLNAVYGVIHAANREYRDVFGFAKN